MTTTAPPTRVLRVAEPDLGPEVEQAVLAVLRSGQLAQGPVVARFEQLCAEMAGMSAGRP